MPNYLEEQARANELAGQATQAHKKFIEARVEQDSARKAVKDAKDDIRLNYTSSTQDAHLDWEQSKFDDATAKVTKFERARDELESQSQLFFLAEGRATSLRTQYSLSQPDFEQVWAVYFKGGEYADARSKAAELAAKARGKEATPGGFTFNKPGNIKW